MISRLLQRKQLHLEANFADNGYDVDEMQSFVVSLNDAALDVLDQLGTEDKYVHFGDRRGEFGLSSVRST